MIDLGPDGEKEGEIEGDRQVGVRGEERDGEIKAQQISIAGAEWRPVNADGGGDRGGLRCFPADRASVQHAGDGAGRLPFGDYWRLGLPLPIFVMVVGVPLIAWIWPLDG